MQFEQVFLYYVLPIVLSFTTAFVMHWLSEPLAKRLLPIGRLTRRSTRTPEQQKARYKTVTGLLSGTLSVVGFTVAVFITMAQFISVDTLIWMVGLFGAGFGFSAKPFIGDYMTGIAFISDDSFDVGEKVEILEIEGVVEAVSLRMTTLRGTNGEMYTIPNGEIRAVRNFSRGKFTPLKVTLKIAATDLQKALETLESASDEALNTLPNMLDKWQVITEEGRLGQNTELTLITQARFGTGAQARPRLLAYVQDLLTAAGVNLVD